MVEEGRLGGWRGMGGMEVRHHKELTCPERTERSPAWSYRYIWEIRQADSSIGAAHDSPRSLLRENPAGLTSQPPV